jgi:NAD(P)-dependent dehydrogenase (short-subunit alcohol dehydrogenase family)
MALTVPTCPERQTVSKNSRVHSKNHVSRVLQRALDVTDSVAVAAFVAAAEVCFCIAGIRVTNSGGPPSNMSKNTPPEARRSVLDQLLMSTVYFARETLPWMQKNK